MSHQPQNLGSLPSFLLDRGRQLLNRRIHAIQQLQRAYEQRAVLLKPAEHVEGTFPLDTKLFGGLKPGVYRVEAELTGWTEEKFTDAERSELAKMAGPFMRGEVSDSIRITLTPSVK